DRRRHLVDDRGGGLDDRSGGVGHGADGGPDEPVAAIVTAEQPGGRGPAVAGQRGEDDEHDEGRRTERAEAPDRPPPCPGSDQTAHTSLLVRSGSGRGLARPELSPAGPIRNDRAQSLRRSTARRSWYSRSLISPRA